MTDTTNSSPLTPPFGSFETVDGRRLFVHSEGTGGPAVVFLPGASAIGLDYIAIHEQVATFTTSVIYDRGGSGYSDPMPLPRSAAAVATELRDLLHARGIPGPYVLAAHSLGGAYAQSFAQQYPSEVAGLVWIDAFHSDWDDYVPEEVSLAVSEKMAPTIEQLHQGIPFMRDYVTAMFADFEPAVRDALIEYHLSDVWINVGHAERGHMAPLAEELRTGPGFPDVPFIALTPTATDPNQAALMSEESLKAMHDGKIRFHKALADSVEGGEQRTLPDVDHSDIAFKGAHHIVDAIRDIVEKA